MNFITEFLADIALIIYIFPVMLLVLSLACYVFFVLFVKFQNKRLLKRQAQMRSPCKDCQKDDDKRILND